ncbi:AraC family transcriptional regulator [Pontiella desulfatans]|nr:DNA-binding transcriptional regulator [Pontiella desulfatans]
MRRSTKDILRVAILVDSTTSWSRLLIEGILEYSKRHGPWHIHLEPQPRDNKLHLPTDWMGDGIICRISSLEMARQLDALDLPVVNISGVQLTGVDYPRVITSPRSEARLVFETFRSRGFQRFAYVGDMEQDFVKRHFLILEKEFTEYGYSLRSFSPGRDGDLKEWLKSLPKPIGVLCWGPSLGHQVIDACQLTGINVPHDVAVLGSNYDELLSEASYPPQAGVRFASEQIGMTAASILDGMMHGKLPEKREWFLEPLGVVEKLSIDTVAVEDARMAKVMRYLGDHALEPITVDDVLKAHPMARRSLERKFRQLFGCSIVEHIRQLRVNHARKLLAETDKPITLVAEACGFSSYNYLNRIFKRATGQTPSEYRAQCRA